MKNNYSLKGCTCEVSENLNSNVWNNHLHFLLREPNDGESLHHSFPIILVADRADPGAVPLNKTFEH